MSAFSRRFLHLIVLAADLGLGWMTAELPDVFPGGPDFRRFLAAIFPPFEEKKSRPILIILRDVVKL